MPIHNLFCFLFLWLTDPKSSSPPEFTCKAYRKALAITTLSTVSNYYEITAELTNFTNRQSVLKSFIAAFASWPASYIAVRLKALPSQSLLRRSPPKEMRLPTRGTLAHHDMDI